MILCYWDFRGFGEPCRYMLEYCGCEYEDRQIARPSLEDHSPWRNIQDNFGLDFPNLPYLIDGDRKLTETFAILKYLGRRHGLVPTNEDDTIRADMIEGVLKDVRDPFYDPFFRPKREYRQHAEHYIKGIFASKVQRIVKFMGDRKWLVNDKLTYLDFAFYSHIAQVDAIYPKVLDKFPRLRKYMDDFKTLPRINEYLKSSRFAEYPKNDPYAKKENRIEDLVI